MTTDKQVAEILDELSSMGSETNRAGMARFGINTASAYGVSVLALRGIAKRFKKNHELALALWSTGKHEARLLALLIENPSQVTEEQAEAWTNDFDSWDLCDQAGMGLFTKTSYAWTKAVEWAAREKEWVKREGFALMVGLAIHAKKSPNQAFLDLLPVIEQGAFDERNFVKKAVNWALRSIGKRNRALNAAAIRCAERIHTAANQRAGGARGGSAEVRAARWVATDAIRELTSEKILARIKI